MKHLILIGGSGVVGTALSEGWKQNYRLTVLDLKDPKQADIGFVKTDATNYQQLIDHIPHDADVLVNLLSIKKNSNQVEGLDMMTDIYFKSSVHVLEAASELGIPKVVFASSNHVTDFYEEHGDSSLGREINVKDYPSAEGIYGILKFASENAGHMYSEKRGLSVINIRIGTVPQDEEEALMKDQRIHKTLLSREDLLQLFTAAVESKVKFGTYYGVSDNPDKPWSIKDAYKELGYAPHENTEEIMDDILH